VRAGRFSGAHEFEHAGLSYEDEALEVSEAQLSEGFRLAITIRKIKQLKINKQSF